MIQPAAGEIYLPVCYRSEYDAKAGEAVRIGSEELTIAGFLRDSQMNSMMASSKRFLVSEADYQKLRPLGSEEYLIEFKLQEDSDINAFATAYEDAGLPGNGPTITYPLIRMMNALSDGMMILVILLISLAVLFISMLCIRCMILTQLEKDKREIGMLKAVGISRKGIHGLYFSKYLVLSAAGCLAGTVMAVIAAGPLGAQMRELYGDAGNMGMIYVLMILGAVLAEGIILLSVRAALKKTERLSAIEAMYGTRSFGKHRSLWPVVAVITAAAVFMVLVPWNMKSTIEAPEFASYMGIGQSQVRIDIRQADAGQANTEQADVGQTVDRVTEELKHDDRVSDYALMQTSSYKTVLADGTSYNLMIEQGDHSKFPVRYSEGRYPEREGEIAVSILNAKEMGVELGDEIRVTNDAGAEMTCQVCGIYSDITNGGKTAKTSFCEMSMEAPVMWSILYLSLADEDDAADWVREYREKYAAPGEGVRVTEIAEYLQGTYGQTIRNIAHASVVSIILAVLILFTVLLLMTRLVIWKERSRSSLKKALGFTSSAIRREYLKKAALFGLVGIVIGIIAGIIPRQGLAGMLLSSMGAYGFHFIIDPLSVFLLIPAVIIAAAGAAVLIALGEVDRIAAFECLGAGSGRC